MNELRGTGPVLIISPHLDDAVLSCGQLIMSRLGTTIMTILAGYPLGKHSGWSGRTTGLSVAKDANLRRRQEDECASSALNAQTIWIDIPAQEYGPAASESERLRGIQEVLVTAVTTTKACAVFVPLGLIHPDHVIVSDAALLAIVTSNLDSYVYMEMPYGQASSRQVKRRLRVIGREFEIEPLAPFTGDLHKKAEAVIAYSSQVKALQQEFGRRFNRVFTDPEMYWRVRPKVQRKAIFE